VISVVVASKGGWLWRHSTSRRCSGLPSGSTGSGPALRGRRALREHLSPYNIEKSGEDRYRIVLALAGFTRDDVEITPEHNRLFMRGRLKERDARRDYLPIFVCRQNLANSSLVHLRLGSQPALHSSFVGLMTKLSPPLGTGSVFGGAVGPVGGDV
jgi:hypothetical protein